MLDINPGLIIWTVVAFVLVLVVLRSRNRFVLRFGRRKKHGRRHKSFSRRTASSFCRRKSSHNV